MQRVGDAAKTSSSSSSREVGRALGSGPRLAMLDLLAQGERSVEQLADGGGAVGGERLPAPPGAAPSRPRGDPARGRARLLPARRR